MNYTTADAEKVSLTLQHHSRASLVDLAKRTLSSNGRDTAWQVTGSRATKADIAWQIATGTPMGDPRELIVTSRIDTSRSLDQFSITTFQYDPEPYALRVVMVVWDNQPDWIFVKVMNSALNTVESTKLVRGTAMRPWATEALKRHGAVK